MLINQIAHAAPCINYYIHLTTLNFPLCLHFHEDLQCHFSDSFQSTLPALIIFQCQIILQYVEKDMDTTQSRTNFWWLRRKAKVEKYFTAAYCTICSMCNHAHILTTPTHPFNIIKTCGLLARLTRERSKALLFQYFRVILGVMDLH